MTLCLLCLQSKSVVALSFQYGGSLRISRAIYNCQTRSFDLSHCHRFVRIHFQKDQTLWVLRTKSWKRALFEWKIAGLGLAAAACSSTSHSRSASRTWKECLGPWSVPAIEAWSFELFSVPDRSWPSEPQIWLELPLTSLRCRCRLFTVWKSIGQ